MNFSKPGAVRAQVQQGGAAAYPCEVEERNVGRDEDSAEMAFGVLVRWASALQCYSVTVQHGRGTSNGNTDVLSGLRSLS